MNPLTRLLEAALFSASRPLTLTELRAVDPSVEQDEVAEALEALRLLYDEGGHGIEVVELAEGFQLLTRPEMAEAIANARIAQRPRKLSAAALETLAIIAYRQPVGRAEIEEVRGVAADGVLRSLQERGLVDAVGRSEGLGRPLLYGTTPKFLEMLGLKDLDELPRRDQLAVALRPIAEMVPGLPGAGHESLDDVLHAVERSAPEGDDGGEPAREVSAPEGGPAEDADSTDEVPSG